MKLILSRSQWESIGLKTGWLKEAQVGDSFTEERRVEFSTSDGELLGSETFTVTGASDLERFENLDQQVEAYIASNFDDPDGIMWEDTLVDVTGNTKDGLKLVAKKKKYKHSPKEHGFIDECIKKNPDVGDPGAYCASIVDKVKGTTKWRKGPKKKGKKKSED